MSSTRYCAQCYAGTDYKVALPTFCSKCGKPFLAAFTQNPTKDTPTKKISSTSDLEETEVEIVDDDVESEEFDETIVAAKAQQFKQALRGIKINIDSSSKSKVRLGEFLKNPDNYSDFGHRQ